MSPRPKPSEPLRIVTVKMPGSLVVKVDRIAESAGESRSDIVRTAVEDFVGKQK